MVFGMTPTYMRWRMMTCVCACTRSEFDSRRPLSGLQLAVRQQGADERVGEPAGVLRLGPAELVAEHAGDVGAGEGPDDLAGAPGADAQRPARGDPLRVGLHVLHAEAVHLLEPCRP